MERLLRLPYLDVIIVAPYLFSGKTLYSRSIKTHLLFLGLFEIKIKYKKYQHTTNY